MTDACGMAGGTVPAHRGPGDAVFAATVFATMGDLGSQVLPPAPSGVQWAAGSAVEVAWGIRYNHGGLSLGAPQRGHRGAVCRCRSFCPPSHRAFWVGRGRGAAHRDR